MANGEKERTDNLKKLRDQYKSLNEDARKASQDILASEVDIESSKRLQLDIAKEINQLRKDGYRALAKELQVNQDQAKELQKKISLLATTKKEYSKINKEAQDIIGNLQDMVKKLPGGKRISKLFGIDKLGIGFEKALNRSAAVFVKTGGNIGMAATAFTRGISTAINPLTIIAAIAAGLVAVFLDFEKKAKGIAEATGLTLSQSKALVKEAKAASQSKSVELATSTDILEVQKATVKEFGIANMLSASQAANVADIGRSFGIGAAKAAEVTNEFMRMGMGGVEAANALQHVSAEALKAGVSVGAVTADIAANAKDVAKFFGGNVKALRKAAVEAAKLGISLATMAKVSDGLLNFEKSISAQFELQALTGRQINLDSARQLALQGDIAGASAEVLKQVGSIADFDSMSVIARRSLAKATGMSVDELQKSLTIQEKLSDLSDDQRAAAMGLGLSAAEIANKSPEQLKTLLAQQEASGQIAKDFAALKDDLSAALIPFGQVLLGIFSAISNTVSFIVDGFKTLKPLLIGVAAIMAVVKREAIKTAILNMASAAFKTFSMPIVGFPLALAAIAGTIGYVKSLSKVGDLGIDPNGGPVVMSPREGGVFQGTKNDGVSMSPSHGVDGAQGPTGPIGPGNTAIASAIAKTNALLQQILDTGTTIEMDGQVVGATLRTSDSFRRR